MATTLDNRWRSGRGWKTHCIKLCVARVTSNSSHIRARSTSPAATPVNLAILCKPFAARRASPPGLRLPSRVVVGGLLPCVRPFDVAHRFQLLLVL